jgi:type III secretory pathway lipoprotein EscJ
MLTSLPPFRFKNHQPFPGVFESVASNVNVVMFIVTRGCCESELVALLTFPSLTSALAHLPQGGVSGKKIVDVSSDVELVSFKYQMAHCPAWANVSGLPHSAVGLITPIPNPK